MKTTRLIIFKFYLTLILLGFRGISSKPSSRSTLNQSYTEPTKSSIEGSNLRSKQNPIHQKGYRELQSDQIFCTTNIEIGPVQFPQETHSETSSASVPQNDALDGEEAIEQFGGSHRLLSEANRSLVSHSTGNLPNVSSGSVYSNQVSTCDTSFLLEEELQEDCDQSQMKKLKAEWNEADCTAPSLEVEIDEEIDESTMTIGPNCLYAVHLVRTDYTDFDSSPYSSTNYHSGRQMQFNFAYFPMKYENNKCTVTIENILSPSNKVNSAEIKIRLIKLES